MKLNENVCKKLSEPAYWSSISKSSLIKYLIYLSQKTKDSLPKDKIQSQYISELTIIKRSYKEMDEQYKTVVEALEKFANEKTSEEVKDFWEDNKLDQKLNILDKKQKLIEAEGVVNFLQTGNERLNDTSKMVHKFQLNFLERNEAKKSRNDELEEAEDANKDELATDNKPYLLRKRRDIDYNEERMIKKQHQDGYSTPSPCSPKLHSLPIDNPFVVKEDEYGTIIIDDVDELCFNDGDPENDLKIGEINISQLFRKYQNESVKVAKTDGLFVESNVHEILALSSIFLLIPGSYSKKMINIFGSPLLDEVYKQVKPVQQTEIDSECESKFRKVIKQATKESRRSAIKSLLAELTNDQTLDKNLDSVILECLKTLPTGKIKNEPSEITLITNYLDRIMKEIFHDPDKHIVEWPNTGLDESKARKSQGRSKQPDFVVSIVHQLQTSGIIFVGEVSPPSEKNNVYKNCNDLIRVGIFMKDCLDSAIDLGADIKLLGFQCVGFTLDFYMMDLIQGTYTMIHIGQFSVPASVKEMLSFVDEIEVLLVVQEIFHKSFNTFYTKICNPSSPSTKASFKRDTLGTPKFKQLVSKTRDCHRSCPFWFGRF
ncbi:17897_t:CDS:2 [Cetraspora pellucida]|uniref:17897_t:CDS:1 n=1 Tax=Cetraspora pellucida TaxID=1433469 RepID=A0A9N8W472_9GLOM|nr:17897_t:CDS:2 [Cetraspora pellucida]